MLRGLVINDPHVGGAWSLFPEGFRLSTGGIVGLNQGQEYLLECYNHMLEQLPKALDFTIINGDVVDGINQKDEGLGRTEPDPTYQVRAAVELLDPIVSRSNEVYVLSGSGYHVGKGAKYEKQFAELIGAEKNDFGSCVYDWLLVDYGGIILDVAHHQSYTMRNRTMPMEREIQFSEMISPDMKPGTDMIIRGHVHTYSYVNVDGMLALTVPAWKLPYPYTMTSRTPNRMLSRLFGAVELQLFPELKGPDVLDRSEYVKHKLHWYPYPKLEIRKGGISGWINQNPTSLLKPLQGKSQKPLRP